MAAIFIDDCRGICSRRGAGVEPIQNLRLDRFDFDDLISYSQQKRELEESSKNFALQAVLDRLADKFDSSLCLADTEENDLAETFKSCRGQNSVDK